MQQMNLKNKNAIITGARRGIGRATVEVFAKNGANVWACARKQDDAFERDMEELSRVCGVWIKPVYFDMSSEAEIKAAVNLIRKDKKSINVLANIAGIVETSTSFTMTEMEKMHRVMDINFFAATLITQYVARLMMRQKYGSIVNVSSIAGLDGTPAQYEYVASKAAMTGATKHLARELAPYQIRVNAVAPGIVETEMGDQMSMTLREDTLHRSAMGRPAKPEEIANVIAFLADDMASYITGQTIRVDGGI